MNDSTVPIVNGGASTTASGPHTREPWSLINRCVIVDQDGDGIASTHARCFAEANASRIVACVNACSGIPTEDLGTPPSITEYISDQADGAVEQRDELAAALREIECLEEKSTDTDFESLVVHMQTIARAALAKVDRIAPETSTRSADE